MECLLSTVMFADDPLDAGIKACGSYASEDRINIGSFLYFKLWQSGACCRAKVCLTVPGTVSLTRCAVPVFRLLDSDLPGLGPSDLPSSLGDGQGCLREAAAGAPCTRQDLQPV